MFSCWKSLADHFAIRINAVKNKIWIDAGQRLSHLVFHAGRIAGRPDHDVVEEVCPEFATDELRIVIFDGLRFGQPEHRANRIFVAPSHVAHVAHDTDDFEVCGIFDARSEVLTDRVLVFKKALAKASLTTATCRVVSVSSSVMGRPCTIFAPMLSKKPGITRAQPAPVSSFGPGSGRPAIRMPSFQLSPLMGA